MDSLSREPIPLSQLPKSWDDGCLLKHEPFLSQFIRREVTDPQRTRGRHYRSNNAIDWPDIIKRETNSEFNKAFDRWVDLAFKSNDGNPHTFFCEPVDHNDPKLWGLFVEIYWEVHQNRVDEARKLLLSERKLRGYIYSLPNPEKSKGFKASACSSKLVNDRLSSATPESGPSLVPPLMTEAKEENAQTTRSAASSKSKSQKRTFSEAGHAPMPPPIEETVVTDSWRRSATNMSRIKEMSMLEAERDVSDQKAKRKRKKRKKTKALKSTNDHETEALVEAVRHEDETRQTASASNVIPTPQKMRRKKADRAREFSPVAGSVEVDNSRWTGNASNTHSSTPSAPRLAQQELSGSPSDIATMAFQTAKSSRKRKRKDAVACESSEILVQDAPQAALQLTGSSISASTLQKKIKISNTNSPSDSCNGAGSLEGPPPSLEIRNFAGSASRRAKSSTDDLSNSDSIHVFEVSRGDSSTNLSVSIHPPLVLQDHLIPPALEGSFSKVLPPVGSTLRASAGFFTENGRTSLPPLGFISPASTVMSMTRTSSSSSSSEETLVDWSIEDDDEGDQVHEDPEVITGIADSQEILNLVEDEERQADIAMSYQLSRPQQTLPKPPLPEGIRPQIWAASRQALCETTTWFRSYHGGVYHNDGKAHGYLLGGYSSQRDMFVQGGRLIISRGGGKSLNSSDQREDDGSVRALLNGYENRHPIVLIADDKYLLFPYDLKKYMYVVLGLYWIVDAWAEKEVFENNEKLETRVKYKFAFQYCEGQGKPWWQKENATTSLFPVYTASTYDSLEARFGRDKVSQNHDESNNDYADDELVELTSTNDEEPHTRCENCGETSPLVYEEGWMCLRPHCASFFRMHSKEQFTLNYDARFLELRPQHNFASIDLTPQSPIGFPSAPAERRYSARGWWCPDCGQLCCRERWECWDCPNCNKVFEDTVPLPIRLHSAFWEQESLLIGTKNFKIHRIKGHSGIKVSTSMWGKPGTSEGGPLYTFELPAQRGRIYLLAGQALSNRRANELFKLYQEEARAGSFLRRYPLRAHHARGRMLANYFSQNSGAPYKYVVGTNDSVPFDQAPKSVNMALQLIKDRVSLVNESADFNEILTAAYMEKQKMAYHTDDEKGLGPVVSSLSLGSIAHMHFRLRKLPTNGQREKELTLVLRHGDVLVMQGAEIQKLYEHTVVPMNFRIAATARYIDSNV